MEEEKVVNGVLCFRKSPSSPWEPYTLESMTVALRSVRNSLDAHVKENLELRAKIQKVTDALFR